MDGIRGSEPETRRGRTKPLAFGSSLLLPSYEGHLRTDYPLFAPRIAPAGFFSAQKNAPSSHNLLPLFALTPDADMRARGQI